MKSGFLTLADQALVPVPRIDNAGVVPASTTPDKISAEWQQLDNPFTVPAGTLALSAAVDARFIKQGQIVTLHFRYTPLVAGGTGTLLINLPFPGSVFQPYFLGISATNAGPTVLIDDRDPDRLNRRASPEDVRRPVRVMAHAKLPERRRIVSLGKCPSVSIGKIIG